MDVGAQLRLVRLRQGLSQRELAKRAGVTNSTISMIEKNSVSPSISSLKKVLSGIPMSLVEFFSMDGATTHTAQVVYRAGELPDISDGTVTMKLVGGARLERQLAFLDETYPPGADTGADMLTHEGEEAGLVLEGRLELTLNGQVYLLEPGDSYYFDSNQPHRFRNCHEQPARLISATTPANF